MVDPAMLQQLLGGGGGPQGPPPPEQQDAPSGDWLAEAINAVHSGMVQEADPKQVSLLGAILNQLTTFQSNAMAPKGGPQGG
jgi:hypothetical protein